MLRKDQMMTTVFHKAGYYTAGAGKIHRNVDSDFGELDAYQSRGPVAKPELQNKGNLGLTVGLKSQTVTRLPKTKKRPASRSSNYRNPTTSHSFSSVVSISRT